MLDNYTIKIELLYVLYKFTVDMIDGGRYNKCAHQTLGLHVKVVLDEMTARCLL